MSACSIPYGMTSETPPMGMLPEKGFSWLKQSSIATAESCWTTKGSGVRKAVSTTGSANATIWHFFKSGLLPAVSGRAAPRF